MANYKPDAHVAQMKILGKLLMNPTCKFTALATATGLSNDHATFHIKKLVEVGFVEHVPHTYGNYRLTKVGKEYANRMDTDDHIIEKQPKLSVVLDLTDNKGRHLQQQRLKHPYYGYWGRPTGKIRWGESILEAAERELKEETGLRADLIVRGMFHKLDYNVRGELLEDKYLCLVSGSKPTGKLCEFSDGQRNVWMSDSDYAKLDKTFGGLDDVKEYLNANQYFIVERKFTYPDEAY